jgi:hypothetical protein
MIDFDNHEDVMQALATAQEIELDRRAKMNDCVSFVTDPDGQWEPRIAARFDEYGRPKYTFDMTSTIVNKFYGEMTQNDFNIHVTPMGGGASKESAKLIAGLIKNTEALSRATNVYSMSARLQMIAGFDCMRVDQDWASPDSFDQDLFIRHIPDSINRVWFLGNYQERTCEDAPGVVVEHLISADEYKERFDKDGINSCQSLGDPELRTDIYFYKRQGVRVGELIYKHPIKENIYLTSAGAILSEEDFNDSGLDIKDVKVRERDTHKICVRWFDAKRFLNDPEDTVFKYLPVVPVLPNFLIARDKPMSKGVVEPLMDWQRTRNYTGSAYLEETALAPKDIIMMTRAQLAGNERDVGKLNVAGRPILTYTHVDGQSPPYKPGAYVANQGLPAFFQMSEQGIQSNAGMFAAGLGDNPGLQSGVAIERLDNNSNLGAVEYFKAQEVALGHIGKILTTAYPKVYDSEQEKRIINDDGSYDMIKLNEVGLNGEIINDLSKGIYDTYCDIGKAFRNRQEQAAEQFVKLGTIDPNIVLENEDILLNSIDSPGMDIAAERARARLMKSGAIPESQWTDEEKEAAMAAAQAAAANPPPPDPNVMIAQAELEKAQAKTAEVELKAIKLQQDQQKLDFDQQKEQVTLLMDGQKSQIQMHKDTMDMLSQMANVLKTIGESREKDTPLTPEAEEAYNNQAKKVVDVQNNT